MRILKLRLSNLNSLTGSWELDFTDPAFADGITQSNLVFSVRCVYVAMSSQGARQKTSLDAFPGAAGRVDAVV